MGVKNKHQKIKTQGFIIMLQLFFLVFLPTDALHGHPSNGKEISLVEGEKLCSHCGTDYAKELASTEGFVYMETFSDIKQAE